jgi:hypothetical protein
MNFGKGGQNIVQSGSNNPNVFRGAGNILGTFLGTKMRRQERDYHREKDEESRIRVNKANAMNNASARIFEGLMQPHVAGNYYDNAFETYGADHPEVKAGNKQADEYVRPEFAKHVKEQGVVSGKHGVFPAPVPAGRQQIETRESFRNADTKIPSAEPFEKSDVNDEAGTIPKFGQDASGNVTVNRKEISVNDINKKRRSIAKVGYENAKPVNNVPMSMRTEDSVAPTDRAWTPEQKASLESERPAPRTENLNTGINDGKGGNY